MKKSQLSVVIALSLALTFIFTNVLGTVLIKSLQKGLTYWVAPWLEQTVTFLPTGFSSGLNLMVFGLAFILILIFEPRGLAHLWSLFKGSYRLWPFSY